MVNRQEVSSLMQRFVRRYLSSGASVTEVFYRKFSDSWVGYVQMDAGMEARLIGVRRGDHWDFSIRDMKAMALIPTADRGGSKPAEPIKLKSIRLKLDQSYAQGLISYEEYCRRLRLIGQR